MSWKVAMMAGLVLLAGCDTRSKNEVYGTLGKAILDRCQGGQLRDGGQVQEGKVHPVYYCGCLSRRLTEGKSLEELVRMEQEPASYLEPPENLVRACAEQSRP